MALDAKELAKLHRIIAIAQKLIAKSPRQKRGRPISNAANKIRANGKRVRRTGKELVQFRAMLKAERKKGVSVSELAKEHNISSAYIYQI